MSTTSVSGFRSRVFQNFGVDAVADRRKGSIPEALAGVLLHGSQRQTRADVRMTSSSPKAEVFSLSGVNFFRPTVIHANLPAFIMVHSNRMAVVCFLRFITSI